MKLFAWCGECEEATGIINVNWENGNKIRYFRLRIVFPLLFSYAVEIYLRLRLAAPTLKKKYDIEKLVRIYKRKEGKGITFLIKKWWIAYYRSNDIKMKWLFGKEI